MFQYLSLLYLLLLTSQQILAQTKKQPVTSKIEKVTVFIEGAQVLRKAKTALPQGKTELVFAGISPNIDKQSVQVKGEGDFTILSVVHQNNYLNEQQRREETEVLVKQNATFAQKLIFERSMLEVYTNEENMLAKNMQIGGANTGIKTADLKEAVDFQRNRLTENLLKQNEIEQNIKKLDSLVLKNNQQLKALNQSRNFATSEVLVTVLAKEPVNSANFEVSYLVQQAGWFATYDLRVKDISNPIDLAFKANIFQSSGEDWKEVKLVVSNGNPNESNVAPQLQTWHLRFGDNYWSRGTTNINVLGGLQGNEIRGKVTSKDDGTPLPGVTVMVKGTTIGTQTDVEGVYVLKVPNGAGTLVFSFIGMETEEKPINTNKIDLALKADAAQLSEIVVTAYGTTRGGDDNDVEFYKKKESKKKASKPLEIKESYQPTTINFEIATPYTIASDRKIYTVDVKSQTVEAFYDYIAVPKLEKSAFLIAQIKDWQELNLLEGEVNLFFEGAFLGKSILDFKNAGDTLSISLGKDKGIVVERKKLKEFSKKQFLSSNKTDSRAYEISIRNNKQQAILITVQDQFPLSTNKQIEVLDQEAKEASIETETQKLTWKYTLPAKQEKKHLIKYSVKYPKEEVVVLD